MLVSDASGPIASSGSVESSSLPVVASGFDERTRRSAMGWMPELGNLAVTQLGQVDFLRSPISEHLYAG